MFYKIDPLRPEMAFDLGADGFLRGDRLWVDLRGDFQPTPSGSTASEAIGGIAWVSLRCIMRTRIALCWGDPGRIR